MHKHLQILQNNTTTQQQQLDTGGEDGPVNPAKDGARASDVQCVVPQWCLDFSVVTDRKQICFRGMGRLVRDKSSRRAESFQFGTHWLSGGSLCWITASSSHMPPGLGRDNHSSVLHLRLQNLQICCQKLTSIIQTSATALNTPSPGALSLRVTRPHNPA